MTTIDCPKGHWPSLIAESQPAFPTTVGTSIGYSHVGCTLRFRGPLFTEWRADGAGGHLALQYN